MNEEKCIGCVLCFLDCGKGVYPFDWERKKSVVVYPESCVVGCQTCANLCPAERSGLPKRG